jgi:hypothetical protein
VNPKDDISLGKDHDQRPRLGADEIINALSHIQGNCPHYSETFALTTISPKRETIYRFAGAVSTPEHRLGQRQPRDRDARSPWHLSRSSPPRRADGRPECAAVTAASISFLREGQIGPQPEKASSDCSHVFLPAARVGAVWPNGNLRGEEWPPRRTGATRLNPWGD